MRSGNVPKRPDRPEHELTAYVSEVVSLLDLQKSLRLADVDTTQVLLKSEQVKDAFRLYRNRCLVSGSTKADQLPSWMIVDEYLYELQLSPEFRQYMREPSKANKETKTQMNTIDNYLVEICRAKPYELVPHVAMFVLRVSRFFESPEGSKYDVVKQSGRQGYRPSKIPEKSERDFDRCSRIMEILRFKVAADVDSK
ncbi:hypothetical protein F5Y19DRAFT_32930 [Xylariaceae sp. FL1651]|nr:hypothetical protein F5Y19DRAFT_32930 [Xylariaceae sp. FL1651]